MNKIIKNKYFGLSLLFLGLIITCFSLTSHVLAFETAPEIKYGNPEDEDSILDAGSDGYEMNGVKYEVYNEVSLYTHVKAASNANEIESIILHDTLGEYDLRYDSFDITRYTSLKNVYILALDGSEIYDMLLDSSTIENLYHVGELQYNDDLSKCNFKNIYYISPFEMEYTFTDDGVDISSLLNASKVENIYYTNTNASWIEDKVDALESQNITNKNNVKIKYAQIDDRDLEFTREQLLIDDIDVRFYYDKPFEIKGNNYVRGAYYTGTMLNTIKYEATDGDDADKVTSLISYANLDNHSIPKLNYDKLALMHGLAPYLTSLTVGEIIVGSASYDQHLEYISSKVTTLRLYYNVGGPTDLTYNETFAGETIMIPEEYKSYYQDVIDNEAHDGKIVYYDQSSYELPLNAFLSDNGNKYEVVDTSLSIAYLESKISEMEEANYEFSNEEPIDITIANYQNELDSKVPNPDKDDKNDDIIGGIVDDAKDFTDDLIEKAKENPMFKTALIATGTILGLALLYVSYKGIKKIIRWF